MDHSTNLQQDVHCSGYRYRISVFYLHVLLGSDCVSVRYHTYTVYKRANNCLQNCRTSIQKTKCCGSGIQCFFAVFGIRIGSGFNQVSGSGSIIGIRILIQEGKNDPLK
jgi:hypothetical protein